MESKEEPNLSLHLCEIPHKYCPNAVLQELRKLIAEDNWDEPLEGQTTPVPELVDILPFVVPYLTLSEVIAIGETSEFCMKTLRVCFEYKAPMTVDKEVLGNYKVLNNHRFYHTYGAMAKRLFLRELPASERAIGHYFYSLTHLSLIDVSIVDSYQLILPITLLTLSLTNCKIDHRYLLYWMEDNKLLNLNELHLENLVYQEACHHLDYYPLQLYCMRSLKKLTIIGKVVCAEMYLPSLKTIAIYAKSIKIFSDRRWNLDTLILDVSHLELSIKGEWSCKDMTLKYWDSNIVRNCKESLRVYHNVDPKYKNDPSLANLKSCNVHFIEPPTRANLMLYKLHEYILPDIVKYLSSRDRVCLAQVDSRVFNMITGSKPLVLRTKDLRGLNERYLNKIAPHIREFTARSLYPSLSRFTHLTKLVLFKLEIGEAASKSLPKGVEELHITDCYVHASFSSYLARLNPTLRSLKFKPKNFIDLSKLTQMRDIEFRATGDEMYTKNYRQFIYRNKNLERVTICVETDKSQYLVMEFANFVAEDLVEFMFRTRVCFREVLKDIDRYYGPDGAKGVTFNNRYRFRLWQENHVDFILNEASYLLKGLKINFMSAGYAQILKPEMDQLQWLHIHCAGMGGGWSIRNNMPDGLANGMGDAKIEMLLSSEFLTIRKCCLDIGPFPNLHEGLMHLIEDWPDLEELEIHQLYINLATANEVEEYLKVHNRTLRINDKIFNPQPVVAVAGK